MVAKTTHKQYELTKNITQLPCGTILHRIRALRDIRDDVKEGTLGGWVESEHNLSQNGTSWIYGEAKCYGQGRVSKKAMLYGEATVCGRGYVTDSAKVGGTTIIRGCCEIGEDSWLYGSDDYNVLTLKQKRGIQRNNPDPLDGGYDEFTVHLDDIDGIS